MFPKKLALKKGGSATNMKTKNLYKRRFCASREIETQYDT